VSLHITKVAYGCTSLAMLVAAVARRAEAGTVRMTTRYIPKRHAEIVDGGSLYWIVKHQIVARARIVAFEETADGRHDIVLEARVRAVRPIPRRAHQGWRYLDANEAPADLDSDVTAGDALPPELAGELGELALL
jgi:hypothetical protein